MAKKAVSATRKGDKKMVKKNDAPVSKKNNKKKDNGFHNPYAEGSVIAEAFDLAKKGTTVGAIEKLCKKRDAHPERVIRQLKWGEFRDARWAVSFDAESGKLKVSPKLKHMTA